MLAPQAERLDTLPTGRQLSYGAYHDQARALRRVLKQVGAGSLEAGLAAVRADEAALREVSAVISLDPKARLAPSPRNAVTTASLMLRVV